LNEPDDRHLPRAAPIEAYGKGGFRFADVSHRGSLLCLPNGIWAADIASPGDIDELALERIFANAALVDHCLIGTGATLMPLPPHLRERFHAAGIAVESMSTGAAVRTYNILLGEGRRVAALLLAVD
jgi:uncharacterized protein